MTKKNEGYKPTTKEVEDARDILIANFLWDQKMQNLSDAHGDQHVVDVRVVAYKEGEEDSPCLVQVHPGFIVER